MMDCCTGFMRYFLIGINILFALLGLALMGIGSYALVEVKQINELIEGNYDHVVIFVICLGLFIALLSVMGCCGASRRNKCMTGTYAVTLSILICLELSAGIVGYVKRDEVKGLLTKELDNSMQKYNLTWTDGVENSTLEYNAVAESWNAIHRYFECSGTEGYTDWNSQSMSDSPFMKFIKEKTDWSVDQTTYPVPDSSCLDNETGCGWRYGEDENKIYSKGCVDKLDDWIMHYIGIIAGSAVGIAVIEMIGAAFGFYLICSENGYSQFEYYN